MTICAPTNDFRISSDELACRDFTDSFPVNQFELDSFVAAGLVWSGLTNVVLTFVADANDANLNRLSWGRHAKVSARVLSHLQHRAF
jgi:hypothetical protein